MRQNKGRSNMLSIGQTVGRLKPVFPDLSISKVRFLEDEGLLKPGRTKGGYRLFSEEDIGRLEEILRLQSEKFLPLAVIKERMSGWRYSDRGIGKARRAEEARAAEESSSQKPISLDELVAGTAIRTDT